MMLVMAPHPAYLVVDDDVTVRPGTGPLTEAAIARDLRAANVVRVDLRPHEDLAAYVNADGHRDGSAPNAVGSCLLLVLSLAGTEPGVYAGPIAVVGWDRTRPELPDERRLTPLTAEQARTVSRAAERVAVAVDGFDTGRQFVGQESEQSRIWDQRVRDHGRRVRAAFLPR